MQALCLLSETVMSVMPNDLELCTMTIGAPLHACRVLIVKALNVWDQRAL